MRRLSALNKNTIVIIILSVLIFLGIVWLIRKNIEFKEGLEGTPGSTTTGSTTTTTTGTPSATETSVAGLSGDKLNEIGNAIKTSTTQILQDAGVDITELEKEGTDLLKQLSSTLEKSTETDISDDANETKYNIYAPLEGGAAGDAGKDTVLPINYSFYASGGNDLSVDFCDIYQSQSLETLTRKCNELTVENCNSTNCCVWLNGKKCVAGNKTGPSLSEDKKDIDSMYYSFKNTCYRQTKSAQPQQPSTTTQQTVVPPLVAGTTCPCALPLLTDQVCGTDLSWNKVSLSCIKNLWQNAGCNTTLSSTSTMTPYVFQNSGTTELYNATDKTLAVIKDEIKRIGTNKSNTSCYST